jgi:hypothetical protein
MAGPWPSKWVGTHILLDEPGKVNGSWDSIPEAWKSVRFDAMDVLFISPIFINTNDKSIMISTAKDGQSLVERFKWIIRAARSANANVKIILEQFFGQCPGGSDFRTIEDSEQAIHKFAMSVGNFMEQWYGHRLPSIDGTTSVSARIDGYDVDVEEGTMVEALPKILAAVRGILNVSGQKLRHRFSVSITPAWTRHLNGSVAQSCDYINMQNYDGGKGMDPDEFLRAVPGLKREQLAWGFSSEQPWLNTAQSFAEVEAKVREVINNSYVGVWTWRINSNNNAYENMFQVWLYNLVHGASLPNAKAEEIVARYWPDGGRTSDRSRALTASELK